MNNVPAKSRKVKLEAPDGPVPHPELFELIKQWRNKKASESEVSHYMILHQKAIVEIVYHLPVSLAHLKELKGFGGRKVERYGEELIQLVKDYRAKYNIVVNDYLPVEKPAKTEKIDTKKVSYDLFRSGKTIDEIADERHVTTQTILNHLSHYVGLGELDILQFIDQDKVAELSRFFEENPSAHKGDAKAKFGETVTWADIQMVLKHIEHTKNTN
ncbi:MAG: hypothetical protein HC906_03945 [Bacteroidales bacterium]|nr:hypothetical protein [Bacteroidales bacterium]